MDGALQVSSGAISPDLNCFSFLERRHLPGDDTTSLKWKTLFSRIGSFAGFFLAALPPADDDLPSFVYRHVYTVTPMFLPQTEHRRLMQIPNSFIFAVAQLSLVSAANVH